MGFKISTEKLKDMTGRVIKGASNNKLIPITELLLVQLKDGELTLVTTDAVNYLYIRVTDVSGDDLYAVVSADKFCKLIARMTCDTVECNVTDNVLVVKGNGTYKFEMQLDDSTGGVVVYPNPVSEVSYDGADAKSVNLATFKLILNCLKPALAVEMDDPCYTGYYVGDSVIATNTFNIVNLGVSGLFGDTPLLVTPEQMELTTAIHSDVVDVYSIDDKLIFEADDCTIYGTVMADIEDYAVDAINELVNTEYDNVCTISRSGVLQVLNRISLFVDPFDNNVVSVKFTESGVEVSSSLDSGIEVIPYLENEKFSEFECEISTETLLPAIKAYTTDEVELHYGMENAIKLVDGDVTYIVSLVEN